VTSTLMTTSMPKLSVVIPVYRCEECLRDLHARLGKAIEGLTDSYELILVEDGGDDGSWDLLMELSRADRRVRAVRLSRNYGQHAAITAGLSLSGGGHVVVMDCDLQDPPEEIPRLYAKANEGYDVVFGSRNLQRAPLHRRLMARLYFGLLNAFAGTGVDRAQGTFSLISRKVVDAYLRFEERDRHYLFILRWLGFPSTSVEYDQAERPRGRSSYTLGRLLRHAFDGIFFQTTVLLRWIVYLGFAISFAGVCIAAYFFYSKLAGTSAPGWTSLAVFTLTIGGFIIISTGVTGLYIGKVFEQVKGRPLFVIDREIVDGAERPHPATDRPGLAEERVGAGS